jgi:hypothetical protein
MPTGKANESVNHKDPLTLSSEEEFFLSEMLRFTGREDRLTRRPLLTEGQVRAFRAIHPAIRESTKQGLSPDAKCDLMNRMLLGLGIKPFSHALFDIVFRDVELSNEQQVRDQVERFRIVCMLEFGSFRYGYKVLKSGKGKHGEDLHIPWERYFPSPGRITELVEGYKRKPPPIGLVSIPGPQLVALGYLSKEETEAVNEARKNLTAILSEAVSSGIKEPKLLMQLAKSKGIDDFAGLLATAGLSDPERVLYPAFHAPAVAYRQILADAKDNCVVMDPEAVLLAQRNGELNTTTYLAMHDVDVYVATSMRDPLHFTSNFAFVSSLFKAGELESWHLRYFDPTQSYVPDRIQKGLTECLMIKRAAVTVYNAQESDTFGKDAEAAVALAQGKPVVVYVARLFADLASIKELYSLVDGAARIEKADLLSRLKLKGFLTDEEVTSLSRPERSRLDCVEYAVKKVSNSALAAISQEEIEGELLRHGYEPPPFRTVADLAAFASEMVRKLERRALLFREIHPLSLQASPVDGVARGVIVTRSVNQTAQTVRGLLVGGLEYEIVDGDYCWTLVEKVTRSPVRVVSKDPVLTTAFWSEWGGEPSEPHT